MNDFSGRVVVVTGGARGQGLAEVRHFARRGARVVMADVLVDDGVTATAELIAEGLEVRFRRLDVTDGAAWDELVATTLTEWGRIDVLVNNAGILTRRSIADCDEASWRKVLDVDLTGAFLGIRAVAPTMCARRSGAIVNIASNSAFSGHVDPAYTAAKWGLRGLTRSAALEFAAFGIRVNCVCPGLVVTGLNRGAPHLAPMIDLTPLGRAVEVDEVASVVGFLASDQAAMITAEDILVDGGFIAGAAYWKVATETGRYVGPPPV